MFLKITLHLEPLMLITLPRVMLMTKMCLQPFLKFPDEILVFQDMQCLAELNTLAAAVAPGPLSIWTHSGFQLQREIFKCHQKQPGRIPWLDRYFSGWGEGRGHGEAVSGEMTEGM